MKTRPLRGILAAALLAGALSLTSVGSAQSMAGMPGMAPQNNSQDSMNNPMPVTNDWVTSSAGGIETQVLYLNPSFTTESDLAKGAKWLYFQFMINTHSGDLSKLDLSKSVVLRNNVDTTIKDDVLWKLTDATSHHPMGILAVPRIKDERDILAGDWFELEITGLGGVHKLKWSLTK